MLKRILLFLLIFLIIGLTGFFFLAGKIVDRQRNTTAAMDVSGVSEEAKALHQKLLIGDLHSDNLLWDRNVLKKIDHGHVDIPRLLEGNVTIQVFDAVIKTPRGLNYQKNTASSDNITLLAMANRWPIRTWKSLLQRALYQANVLQRAATRSEGQLTVVRTSAELQRFLDSRRSNPRQVAGLLSIEGLHALEGKQENLDRLWDAGYRIMGLTHFFDNEIGGSSSGAEQGGLTPLGRKVVQQIEDIGGIVDLAHASPKVVEEVLAMATKPMVVTHTGLQAVHGNPRNLSDDQVRRIAEKGGLIGIGFWDGALNAATVDEVVKTIRHAVEIAGIGHVGLGSDFDGSTHTCIDSAHLILLTDALLKAGFSEEEIGQIMGGNQIRFLLDNLPGE